MKSSAANQELEIGEVFVTPEQCIDNRLVRIDDAAYITMMGNKKSLRSVDIVSTSIPSGDRIKYVLRVTWKMAKYLTETMATQMASILSGSHLFSNVEVTTSDKRQIIIEMYDDKGRLEELANLPFELASLDDWPV